MIKACKYKICFIVTKLIKGVHHTFYTWTSVYGHKKLYLAGEMWQTIYFVTLKHAFEHLHKKIPDLKLHSGKSRMLWFKRWFTWNWDWRSTEESFSAIIFYTNSLNCTGCKADILVNTTFYAFVNFTEALQQSYFRIWKAIPELPAMTILLSPSW